ncbi:hypothetical protein AYO38_12100 [bacterium SCGC AG-212-C10]|nr:hypothetical protein AYO38_12100 [bacterium SCGC AG-212-C10]
MGEGVSQHSKRAFADMVIDGGMRLKSYKIEPSSVVARELAPGAGFIAYRVNADFENQGKPEHIDSYCSSVWVKRGSAWECALSTESRANN